MGESRLLDVERLKKLQLSRDELPKVLGYQNSIPYILGCENNENVISNYLAYILDPNKNGVGLAPLYQIVSLKYSDIEGFYEVLESNIKRINVIREYVFDNGRRIDLLIKVGSEYIIGIENKIKRSEETEQTKDYSNSLEKEDAIKFLFFLAPNKPKKLSCQVLDESKRFKYLSYADLYHILKEIKFDFTKDICNSVIFDNFIKYLEARFMNNKKVEISNLAKWVGCYLDNKNLISEINQNKDNFIITLVRLSEEYFIDLLNDETWKTKFENSFQAIYKESWDMSNYFIHHEFMLSNDFNRIINNKMTLYYYLHIEDTSKEFRNSFIQNFSELYEKKYGENIILKNSRTMYSKTYTLTIDWDKFDFSVFESLYKKINKEIIIPFSEIIDEALKKIS